MPAVAPGPPSPLSIYSLDSPEFSGPGSLTFAAAGTPLRMRTGLRAALVLSEPEVEFFPAPENPVPPVLRVGSVHASMAALLHVLEPRILRRTPFVSGGGNRVASSAMVEGCLEGNVSVGPGAYVGKGSFIGAGTRIEPNAVILDHCFLGRDCVIQSGAVIGCAGFGFYPARAAGEDGALPADGLLAMPHLAGVEMGEGCWIGANTVVAAGVLHPTRLGLGCKLDSHVQIAHNVRIGDACLLASQSGIAGSTVAGHRLRMGGAASVAGHLRLGNDVSVAACSGVTKDLPDRAVVAGFPAIPIKAWRLREMALRRMAQQRDAKRE